MAHEVRPLTGVMGAEVLGVDLATLEGESLAEIRRLMCEREVVVFRDQSLTPRSQSEFSERLGPSGEVPFVETMNEFPHVIRVVNVPGRTAVVHGAGRRGRPALGWRHGFRLDDRGLERVGAADARAVGAPRRRAHRP